MWHQALGTIIKRDACNLSRHNELLLQQRYIGDVSIILLTTKPILHNPLKEFRGMHSQFIVEVETYCPFQFTYDGDFSGSINRDNQAFAI